MGILNKTYQTSGGFPGGSVVKNLLPMQETWVQSLGREDPLEKALGGTRRVGGLLGVAGRLSGTVSPFRAEQGTSLETPW